MKNRSKTLLSLAILSIFFLGAPIVAFSGSVCTGLKVLTTPSLFTCKTLAFPHNDKLPSGYAGNCADYRECDANGNNCNQCVDNGISQTLHKVCTSGPSCSLTSACAKQISAAALPLNTGNIAANNVYTGPVPNTYRVSSAHNPPECGDIKIINILSGEPSNRIASAIKPTPNDACENHYESNFYRGSQHQCTTANMAVGKGPNNTVVNILTCKRNDKNAC